MRRWVLVRRSGRMPVGDGVEAPAAPISTKDVSKEQIDLVSKAMKGMKPEQAAAIIARLDRTLGSEVLRRMRPADAGLVMAQLKPEVAADLATIIATRKPLGDDGKEVKR